MSTFWSCVYLLFRLSTFWQGKSAFWHVKLTFWKSQYFDCRHLDCWNFDCQHFDVHPSKTVRLSDHRKWDPKVQKRKAPFWKSVSIQANIRTTFFKQRSPQYQKWHISREGTFNIQHAYNIQTDITTTRLTWPRGLSQWKFIYYIWDSWIIQN